MTIYYVLILNFNFLTTKKSNQMKENSGCGKNQPQKNRMTTRAAMAFLKRVRKCDCLFFIEYNFCSGLCVMKCLFMTT